MQPSRAFVNPKRTIIMGDEKTGANGEERRSREREVNRKEK